MITERGARTPHLNRATTALFVAATQLAAMPRLAFAHHAMGGRTPVTFLDGLLSGLAHPLIEPAHLAAILLAGAVAARLGRRSWIAFLVMGSFVGTAVLTREFPLSPSETVVWVTPLLLAAFLCLRSPATGPAGAVALLAVGVVHGMAFAESIVGAEATPIAAYLLGLALAELALASMAAAATASLLRARVPRTE